MDGPGQIYEKYGLEQSRSKQAGADWFEAFAGFLRNRLVAAIVVMIGITCLILELKIPGVGLPGVISALCFVLFFWAHAQLAFTWLAVLLFLLGLVLIALEIFVMPGVAVLGFSGVVMVLAGLGLATMERWPQTESEWVTSVGSLGQFGLAFLGAVFAAVIVARYLPSIPYANRMVLVPPGERVDEAADEAAPGIAARRLARRDRRFRHDAAALRHGPLRRRFRRCGRRRQLRRPRLARPGHRGGGQPHRSQGSVTSRECLRTNA